MACRTAAVQTSRKAGAKSAPVWPVHSVVKSGPKTAMNDSGSSDAPSVTLNALVMKMRNRSGEPDAHTIAPADRTEGRNAS